MSRPTVVITDSTYCLGALDCEKARRGAMPVKNAELILAIRELMRGFTRLEFRWKSRGDSEYVLMAHSLAHRGARLDGGKVWRAMPIEESEKMEQDLMAGGLWR